MGKNLYPIRGVARIWQGGAKNFFSDYGICMSRCDMLRMALPCTLLGGFGDMFPREFFFKWCTLVRFAAYLDRILPLKNFKYYYFLYIFFTKYHFLIKKNIFLIHVCYGVILMRKFFKTFYD